MKPKHSIFLFIPFFLIGCFVTGNETAEMQIGIDGDTLTLRKAIKVKIQSNGWSNTLSGTEISTPNTPNISHSFVTPKSGNIDVMFMLSDSTGALIDSGMVSLVIKPDWLWSVTFSLTNHNPFNQCIRCDGYTSFAIDSVFKSSNEDSLFVTWSGKSINNSILD